MSEPLSIAAGVVGILTAAAQITRLLCQFTKASRSAPSQARYVVSEVSATSGILSQLQSLLLGSEYNETSRTSLLRVNYVQTIISSCVLAFSELEQLLDGLKTGDMSVIYSMKWARKEGEIMAIIQRMQNHKASLSLMLSIVHGCVPDPKARS